MSYPYLVIGDSQRLHFYLCVFIGRRLIFDQHGLRAKSFAAV